MPTPRFVRDRTALDEVLVHAKQTACPHCRRADMVVGHGLLRGYAERGNDREIRGRRLLCSSRFRRSGCGRTFSVLLAAVIARFTARTSTVAGLLEAAVAGASRKAAWERLQESPGGPGLTLRSAYRLWARLAAAQSRIRTALSTLVPPPPTTDARPIAQVLAHLKLALGSTGCLLAAYQLALQRGVFA